MDTYNINRIINSINKALESYPDVKFKLEVEKNDLRGFILNVSGVEKENLSYVENDNLRLSRSLGFNTNIIGLEFRSIYSRTKDMYRILEILPNRRKNSILALNLRTEKEFVFPPSAVKDYFGNHKTLDRAVRLEKLLTIDDE